MENLKLEEIKVHYACPECLPPVGMEVEGLAITSND